MNQTEIINLIDLTKANIDNIKLVLKISQSRESLGILRENLINEYNKLTEYVICLIDMCDTRTAVKILQEYDLLVSLNC